MTSVVLETARLRIRDWDRADAARVLDIHSRPEVIRWLGQAAPVPMADLAEAAERIERWNARADPPCGYWAIEIAASGLVAGAVSLTPVPGGDGEIEVAWHLHPDTQGHGYATEAAAAVIRRGFAAGLPEIIALTDLDNLPSQAVCRRLGLTEIGVVDTWYEAPSRLFRITAREHAATEAAP